MRGGIIDIFPVSSPDPFRLEFWGDDFGSLRIYDPIGQKSIKPIDQRQRLLQGGIGASRSQKIKQALYWIT